MAKKIAIITLYGNVNYGNRLQNYAVQSILHSYGFDVTTLVGVDKPLKYFLKNILDFSKILIGNEKAHRMICLSRFNNKFIRKKFVFLKHGFPTTNIADNYDFFCVGSDQVWNPEIRKNERPFFFLQFAQPHKRICVSPSISVNEIPINEKKNYESYLKSFRYLSCREKEGAELISHLTCKECICTIDPTLILTCEEWRSFSNQVYLKNSFVLLVFLGDIDDKLMQKIKKYALERNLSIVNLFRDKNYDSVSPNQFVWLIDHAEIVFTDSFHATAFSINMRTSFYVFDRYSLNSIANHINSRIVSLVEMFSLSHRYIKDIEEINIDYCIFDSNLDDTLIKERKKFFEHLNISLGVATDEKD